MTSYSDPKRGFPNVPPPAGGSRAVYARFIPREELAGYTSWQPGEIDAAANSSPLERRREPRAADGAAPSIEQWREKLALARSEGQQAGYQEGYRDGLAALDGFKRSAQAELAARFGGLVEAFDAGLAQHEGVIAKGIAEAAVLLARELLRAELQARPELVGTLAQQAVNAVLMSARSIVVQVHPDDLALVAAGAGEALRARGARLVADANITRGGCKIQSDAGTIDAGLPARWAQAAAGLGSQLPWESAA
jgi:flagellar assembly protein FliH